MEERKVSKWWCLVPIIIIASLFISFLYLTEDEINYGISLFDKDIPRGYDIILNLDVKNGYFSHSLSNVSFDYWISYMNDTPVGDVHSIYLIILDSGESFKESIIVPTANLSANSYKVNTRLFYDEIYYKQLELGFKIYGY